MIKTSMTTIAKIEDYARKHNYSAIFVGNRGRQLITSFNHSPSHFTHLRELGYEPKFLADFDGNTFYWFEVLEDD